ncbi:Ribosome maturation factor RimP [uncultured delta proteobacterium]|uniref:Ribosome maturation factor RimP n=1 Tax=uncultured delta proteobacterium TaxID=34034 RepID=A0A212JGA0_9DELT|nr:Ribosome maturation factor RimP [uncultured delta proteobacterium]
MNESTLARTIADLARPLAASLDLAVWGVEAMQGKRAIIRVYVEGEGGVDIDKCAELSRLLGLTLDVEDVIPGAYVLEVSSPGLERTFFTPEQLAARVGETVEVTLHTPVEAYPGRKKVLGTLTEASGGTFSVVPLDTPKDSPDDAPLAAVFAWDDIKKAKRVHFLPETPEPAKGKKPKTAKPPKGKKTGGNENEDDAAL